MTAWDFASKTGNGNDYSANVVLGRTMDGRICVLDVWKSKLDFSQLPGIMLERYRAASAKYQCVPALGNSKTRAPGRKPSN